MSLHLAATLTGHADRVWHVSWHPTLAALATCSGDKTVRVWAPAGAAWQCIATLEEFSTRTVRTVEWSPCGRFLAASSFDSNSTVWRCTGDALAAARASGGADAPPLNPGALRFEVIAVLEGHDNEVKGIAWSPSGRLLATCGRDKSVWLWEVVDDDEGGASAGKGGGGSSGNNIDFECVAVMHGHEGDVKALAWHPFREILVSVSYDDTVRVWGEAGEGDWECVQTLAGVHTSTVWGAAFEKSTGGLLATVGDDRRLIVSTASTPASGVTLVRDALLFTPVMTMADVHSRSILSCAWAQGEGGVEGEGAKGSDPVLPFATHPRGVMLLATGGSDDALCVFAVTPREGADAEGGAWDVQRIASNPNAHAGDVNVVRWGVLGGQWARTLASGGDDGVVRVWEWK